MSSNFYHPAHPLFATLMKSAPPDFQLSQLREILAARVSSRSRNKLGLHLDESLRVYSDHPVVGPWLESLPKDILDNPSDGYRSGHGLLRLEQHHSHRDAKGKARVGYIGLAVVNGVGVLVLLVADSAGLENIETRDGHANAWAELVVAAWNWAWAARAIRFPREDRMNRSNPVFVRIDSAVKARPGARYYWGEVAIDPHRDAHHASSTGSRSSEESETGKTRRLAGFLRKLQQNLWPSGSLPVGLRYATSLDPRGNEVADPDKPLVPDEGRSTEIHSVLEGYANEKSMTVIALEAALEGARNGMDMLMLPKLIPVVGSKQRVIAQIRALELFEAGSISAAELQRVEEALSLPSTAATRMHAAQAANAYVMRIVAAASTLQSGVVDILRIGATTGRTDYLGWSPTFVVDDPAMAPDDGPGDFVLAADLEDGHPYTRADQKRKALLDARGFWRCQLPLGSPVELPDNVWANIHERAKREVENHDRRAASGRSRPLAGLRWTDANGDQYRIRHGGDSGTYSMEGPAEAGGAPVHLHTINASQAARDLGRVLLDLAERVETTTLPLLPSAHDNAINPRDLAEGELERHQHELRTIGERLITYETSLASLDAASLRYRSVSAAREADEARATALELTLIPAARMTVDSISEDMDDLEAPGTEEVQANFFHLVTTGLALMNADPYAPSQVSDALTWLLGSGRGLHNFRRGEGRQLLIDVKVQVQLLDGTVEWMDAGTWDLTDRRLTPERGKDFAADAARRLLRDGEPIEAVTSRFNLDTPNLFVRVGDWLSSQGLTNQYLRSAIITAAAASSKLPSPAVVYASLVGDADDMSALRCVHGDWIVDRILDAFLSPNTSWSHSTGWVRKPLGPWRAAMAGIALSGPVRRQSLVACVDGITNDELIKDHLVPGRCSYWQPPLEFRDGWVRAHRCARSGCPGGGDAPMAGLLPVPELLVRGDAVFCTYCWHSKNSDQPLPQAYRQLWDVATCTSALRRADGIPFLAAAPPVPIITCGAVRTRDIAKAAGVRTDRVQRLAKANLIPSTTNASGKRCFDAHLVDSPAFRALAQHSESGKAPSNFDAATTFVGATRASALLGIRQAYLRVLVRGRALSNHATTEGVGGYSVQEINELLQDVRAQLNDDTATFADLVSVSTLAADWHVTTPTVAYMVGADVIKGVTVGDIGLVGLASVRSLEPRIAHVLTSTVRLYAKEVAKRSGLGVATVLYHATTGTLPAVQLYPRGRVYFIPEEVNTWIAGRAQAKLTHRRATQTRDTNPTSSGQPAA